MKRRSWIWFIASAILAVLAVVVAAVLIVRSCGEETGMPEATLTAAPELSDTTEAASPGGAPGPGSACAAVRPGRTDRETRAATSRVLGIVSLLRVVEPNMEHADGRCARLTLVRSPGRQQGFTAGPLPQQRPAGPNVRQPR